MTSSSSSSFGPVASARATSSRRCSATVSVPATAAARLSRPTNARVSSARLRAASPTTLLWIIAPTITFSHAVMDAKVRTIWNVRAMPSRAARSGVSCDQYLAVECDAAGVGGVEARKAVEQGRLAGTVGADQSDDLAATHSEADILVGAQSAEMLAQTAHLEQGSGHGFFPSRRTCSASEPAPLDVAPGRGDTAGIEDRDTPMMSRA